MNDSLLQHFFYRSLTHNRASYNAEKRIKIPQSKTQRAFAPSVQPRQKTYQKPEYNCVTP
jgi:hypothetical protein